MTKEEAIKLYGGNAAKLARALDISPQAVYQWKDNAPIPEVHRLRLVHEIKPKTA